MPIPSPKKGEEKKKFIPRCISQLAKEGERFSHSQRIAICFEEWRKSKRAK